MKTHSEKEKKLDLALDKLKNLNLERSKFKNKFTKFKFTKKSIRN